MIVHTMTEAELFNEVLSDTINALRFSDVKNRKFRRLVLRANKFPVYAHSIYMSPRKNPWLIFFEARSKKEIGENGRVTFVTYYNSPQGYYAIMPTVTNGRKHLIMYLPHFFSRYALRCHIPLTGIELIKCFFKTNPSYALDFNAIDGFVEVFAKTEQGICLGIVTEGNNFLFKTFISLEMTKGCQIEKASILEQFRKENENSR